MKMLVENQNLDRAAFCIIACPKAQCSANCPQLACGVNGRG